jgi:predicted RNA-binding Zn ribbon-like protein
MIDQNWLCLELLKTRGWESRDRDDDVLDSPVRFVAFARKQGLLTSSEAHLLRSAAADSAWFESLVDRVREMRELLHRMFARVADGQAPDAADLEALEGFLAASAQKLALATDADRGISWRWNDRGRAPLTGATPEELGPAATARIVGALARSAADLLTCGELERVKVCDAHDCGWLFVDVSRNRSRRWCDMAGCGNRDKARRYRERHG